MLKLISKIRKWY